MKNSLKLAITCLLTLSISNQIQGISDTAKGFAFFATGTVFTAALIPGSVGAFVFDKADPTPIDLLRATQFLKTTKILKETDFLTKEQYLQIREKIGLSSLALCTGASLAFLASAVFTTKAIFGK